LVSIGQVLSIGSIFFKPLAKPNDFIIGVTERLIKFYHRIVGCSNLEIYFFIPACPAKKQAAKWLVFTSLSSGSLWLQISLA